MACIYIYKGKRYTESEFRRLMKGEVAQARAVNNGNSKYIVPEGPMSTRGLRATRYVDAEGNDVGQKILEEHPEIVKMQQSMHEMRRSLNDTKYKLDRTRDPKAYQALKSELQQGIEEHNILKAEIEAIRKPYLDSVSTIVPAEVAMEFSHFNTFKIDKSKKHSIDEIFTLSLTDGTHLNVRDFLKENSKSYYMDHSDGIDKLKGWLKQNWNKIDKSSVAFESLSDMLKGDDKVSEFRMLNWFDKLVDATFVFGSRVPSSMWASSFSGEITSITYGSPSVIYTSHEKNVLDDSDYDIDQLSVIFANIGRDETDLVSSHLYSDVNDIQVRFLEIAQNATVEDLENMKFLLQFQNTLKLSNMDKYTVAANLSNIKDIANRVNPKDNRYKQDEYNSNLNNFKNSNDGKNLVAYTANAIHAVATTLHLRGTQKEKVLPGLNLNDDGTVTIQTVYGTEERYLIAELAANLQLSVDNLKHMTAGRINFNHATSNIVVALKLRGMSDEDIYDILNSKIFKEISDKVLDGMSIDQTNHDIYELVNNTLDRLVLIHSDEYLASEYQTKIGEHLNRINYLQDILERNLFVVEELAPSMEGTDQQVGATVNVEMSPEGTTRTQVESELKEAIKWVEDTRGMGEEEYVTMRQEQTGDLIEKMSKVRDAVIDGEVIFRLSRAYSAYNDIPSSPADLYSFAKSIEWITRQEFDAIAQGYNPTESFVNEDSKQNEDFKKQMFDDRLAVLEGNDKINKPKVMYQMNQREVNTVVSDLLTPAITNVLDREYNGKRLRDQINLAGISGGQSGVDVAGAVAMNKAGVPTVVYMPKGYRHVKREGNQVYNSSEEEVRQMYTGLNNNTKIFFRQLGVDVDIPNPTYYANRTKFVIDKAHHTISINYNEQSAGMRLTNSLARGKMTKIQDYDLADDVIQDTQKKIEDDLYTAITNMLFEARSTGYEDDVTFVLNVAGNDLSNMQTSSMSEAEAFIEFEGKIDERVNVLAAIRNNRALMSYYNTISTMRGIMRGTFYQMNERIENIARDLSKRTGGIGVLSKKNYVKFINAIDAAVGMKYIEDRYSDRTINIYEFGDFKEVKTPLMNSNSLETLVESKLNLNNTEHLNAFMYLFPKVALYYREEIDSNNEFLKRLYVDAYGNLIVRGAQQMNPADIEMMKRAFTQLPEELKEMLFLYNLAAVGFKNNMKSMSIFLDETFYEDYSKTVDSVISELESPDSDFASELEKNIIGNIVVANPEIARYGSKKIVQNPTIRSEYVRMPRVREVMGRPVKSSYNELFKLREEASDISSEAAYSIVYGVNSGRINGLIQFRKSNESRLQLIRLTDTDQIRNWLNQQNAELHTRKVHSYKQSMSNDVFSLGQVYGKPAYIDPMSITSVRVRPLDRSEFNDMKYAHMKSIEAYNEGKSEDKKKLAPNWESIHPESRVVYEGRRMTRRGLERVIKQMSKAFPSLRYNIVTNNTTTRLGARAYFENGGLYYNMDMVTYDTPIHEIMHPIIYALANSENSEMRAMGDMFMQLAQDQITENSELYQVIMNAYPGIKGDDLLYELASTIAGFVSEEKVSHFLEKPQTLWESIKNAISTFWNNLVNVFNNLFVSDGYQDPLDISIPKNVPQYSIDSTYKDMINHLIDMVLSGETNMLNSEFQELAWANTWDSRPLVSTITDVSELENELLLGAEVTENVKSIKGEYVVNSIFNQVRNSVDKTYKVGDRSFDLSSYMEQGMEQEARKHIREEILPVVTEMKDEFVKKLVTFMNEGDISKKNIQEEFELKSSTGKKISMMSPNTMYSMLSLMEYSGNSNIIQLSKLMQNKTLYSDLAEHIPTGFKGSDPFVVIHSIKEVNGKQQYDISLFEITAESLSFKGRGLGMNALLTDNFEDSSYSRNKGVSHKADLLSAKQLILGMQMMAIKKSIPSINIRRAGVIEIQPFMGTRKTAGKLSYAPVDMNTIGPSIKVLANSMAFRDKASSSILDVIIDEKYLDPETYNSDYLSMLLSMWSYNLNEIEDYYGSDTRGYTILKHRHDLLDDYLNGKGGQEELRNAMELQMQYLRNSRGLNTKEKQFSNIEYRILNFAYNEIVALRKLGSMSHMHVIDRKFRTQFQQENPIIQNMNDVMFKAYARINDEYHEAIKGLDDLIKPYVKDISILKMVLSDPSDEYFKHLFIMEEHDGQMVNVARLHWDKNDQRTREALAMNQITEDDLKVTNYVLDLVEKHLKGIIRQTFVGRASTQHTKDDGTLDMDLIEEAVKDVYNRGWSRGILPVMTKTPFQMMLSGKQKETALGFKKWFQKVSNPQKIMTELIDINQEIDSADTIVSAFYNQLTRSQNQDYGGDFRLKMLGLEIIDDAVRVIDKTQNDSVSMNIYNIVKHLVMDEVRKRNMEDDVLPMFNVSRLLSTALGIAQPQGDAPQVSKTIEDSFYKNVAGKNAERNLEKNIEGLAGASRGMLMVTTLAGVAFSLPVMVTSAVANIYELGSNALANQAGNPYSMPTIIDEVKAVKLILTQLKKVKALEMKYHVIESDSAELLNKQKYDITKNNIANSDLTNIGNRETDITARRVAFVGQMIHDGVWEAHDEDGNYDPKKDKRLYNADGSQTDLQKGFMKSLMKDLIKDRVPGQVNNPVPVRAYSYTEERKLVMVGTEYGVGVYDRMYQPLGKNDLWYNALMQFKNFANSAVGTRIIKKMSRIEGGERKPVIVDGQVVRDAAGDVLFEFQEVETEGTWRTTGRLLGETAAMLPLVGELMTKVGIVDKKMSLSDWKKLTDLERRNLAKTAFDAVALLAAYFLVHGLFSSDENKDKFKKIRRYGRLTRAVQNGLLTAVAASPMEVLNMATNIASIQNAKRFFNIFTFQATTKDLLRMTPGGSTISTVQELVN